MFCEKQQQLWKAHDTGTPLIPLEKIPFKYSNEKEIKTLQKE